MIYFPQKCPYIVQVMQSTLQCSPYHRDKKIKSCEVVIVHVDIKCRIVDIQIFIVSKLRNRQYGKSYRVSSKYQIPP